MNSSNSKTFGFDRHRWISDSSGLSLVELSMTVCVIALLLLFMRPIIEEAKLRAKRPYKTETAIYNKPQTERFKGSLRVNIPSAVKVSDTISVTAHIKADLESIDRTEMPKAKLVSPDFQITEAKSATTPSENQEFDWVWLVSSQNPGQRLLYLGFDPPCDLEINDDLKNPNFQFNGDALIASITVTDALGFTAWEKAAFGVLASLLTLGGVILAYPMIKRFWEEKHKPLASPTTAGPATAEQGSKRQLGKSSIFKTRN